MRRRRCHARNSSHSWPMQPGDGEMPPVAGLCPLAAEWQSIVASRYESVTYMAGSASGHPLGSVWWPSISLETRGRWILV